MKTFSSYFKLNKSQAELDFVDIFIRKDLPLFIPPYIFSDHKNAFIKECSSYLESFYEELLGAISKSDAKRGRQLLNYLSEPRETHLGVSKSDPKGRGIGRQQAIQLYESISSSKAGKTGLISDLTDLELFIEGIGPDKVSDIMTNIIRRPLIAYTQMQCELHGIPCSSVPSGTFWDKDKLKWDQGFVNLPLVEGNPKILIPKSFVRFSESFSHSRYYRNFVVNFLRDDHIERGTALVQYRKNKSPYVTKKAVMEDIASRAVSTKEYLATFSEQHPEVLKEYKTQLALTEELPAQLLEEGFNDWAFSQAIIKRLELIDMGSNQAASFHSLMIGALEYIFYPFLKYPEKEKEISQGTKRIDICYTNDADGGFFKRRLNDPNTKAVKLMVECKNYAQEITNPEIDQLLGRFSNLRGSLGFLIGRKLTDRNRLILRCREAAAQGRGIVIPLMDEDIIKLLEYRGQNNADAIDRLLENLFTEITS